MKVLTIAICSLIFVSSYTPKKIKVYSKWYLETGKRLVLFPNNEFNLRSYSPAGTVERIGAYENVNDTLRLMIIQQSCGLFNEAFCDTSYVLNYLMKDEEVLFEILDRKPYHVLKEALGDSLFKDMIESPPVLWQEFR